MPVVVFGGSVMVFVQCRIFMELETYTCLQNMSVEPAVTATNVCGLFPVDAAVLCPEGFGQRGLSCRPPLLDH